MDLVVLGIFDFNSNIPFDTVKVKDPTKENLSFWTRFLYTNNFLRENDRRYKVYRVS